MKIINEWWLRVSDEQEGENREKRGKVKEGREYMMSKMEMKQR